MKLTINESDADSIFFTMSDDKKSLNDKYVIDIHTNEGIDFTAILYKDNEKNNHPRNMRKSENPDLFYDTIPPLFLLAAFRTDSDKMTEMTEQMMNLNDKTEMEFSCSLVSGAFKMLLKSKIRKNNFYEFEESKKPHETLQVFKIKAPKKNDVKIHEKILFEGLMLSFIDVFSEFMEYQMNIEDATTCSKNWVIKFDTKVYSTDRGAGA